MNPKTKTMLRFGVSALIVLLAGCATTQQRECELLATAYYEQDELATAWYDTAAAQLVECGYAPEHKQGCRGRDSDGHYNLEKKRCDDVSLIERFQGR